MTAAIEQEQSLHPNLARIAAEYDRIVAQFARKEISVTEARGRVTALVARDDEGTLWSIDPDTAEWRYRSHSGMYVRGTPPTYGFPSPSPHQVSMPTKPRESNPDRTIVFSRIDEQALYPPTELTGSTRRFAPQPVSHTTFWARYGKRIAIALAAVVIGLVAFFAVSGTSRTPSAGTTPTTAPTPAPTTAQTPAPTPSAQG